MPPHDAKHVELSVVIPVFDEIANLPALFARLTRTLDAQGMSYELVFTDDGSRDGSLAALLQLAAERPGQVVVVEFNRNYGQHMAVVAGLREARGEILVTLDADLQNPPEEIPKLLRMVEKGHDLVGTYRELRHDSAFRRGASQLVNAVSRRITGLRMRDQGCMLRAYRRDLVERILQSQEASTFIPALAMLYAGAPTEIAVEHAARGEGRSKYGLYRLIRLNFDLITGFSAAPLQAFTVVGLLVSLASGALVTLLALRRIFVGPEVEGIFTLMGILFFLMGVLITGVGIVGEYVARIYHEVRRRPPYVVRKVHGRCDG